MNTSLLTQTSAPVSVHRNLLYVSLLKIFFLFQSGNHRLTNCNMEIHVQVDVLVTLLQNVNNLFIYLFLVHLYFMQLAYGNL